MSESITSQRVEPIIDPGGPAPAGGTEAAHPPVPGAQPASSRPSTLADQLARLEDKTARIEEKLARSEAATQRVVDKFDMASQRMSEVAQQSDLTHVRGDAHYIARRVKRMPSTSDMIVTAVIASVLTSILTAAIFRFFPAIFGP